MATEPSTRERLLAAARECLLHDGYARLSTRRIADHAGVPLSQIHYHFGGRQGLVLALLAQEDARRLERQRRMYGQEAPLWQRYEQACDFLEEDLAEGYVRVLQEMVSAGWSDPAVAQQVNSLLERWMDLLAEICVEAEARLGSLGPMAPADLGLFVGMAFLGGEQLILLGDADLAQRARGALRRIGQVLREVEERAEAVSASP